MQQLTEHRGESFGRCDSHWGRVGLINDVLLPLRKCASCVRSLRVGNQLGGVAVIRECNSPQEGVKVMTEVQRQLKRYESCQ